MSNERLPSESTLEINLDATSSTGDDVQRDWQGVVKRRSFLSGLGITAAVLSADELLPTESRAEERSSRGRLSPGDVAWLQFALWPELVESDLWTQGVGPSGGGEAQADEEFQGVIGGNPAYNLALQNLDGDMPQYISDNTDDELSHAAFLPAFLRSKGQAPLDLEPFQTLRSSEAIGARQIKRITNLMNPSVDLSWYFAIEADRTRIWALYSRKS